MANNPGLDIPDHPRSPRELVVKGDRLPPDSHDVSVKSKFVVCDDPQEFNLLQRTYGDSTHV